MKNYDHPNPIPVEIGDESREFKLGLKALGIARDRHRVQIRGSEMSDPGLDTLARLAWIACLPDDPSLKESDFLESVDESGALNACIEAIQVQLAGMMTAPKGKAKNAKAGKAAK